MVYLNGQELCRDNMPAGVVTHTTLASAEVGHDGTRCAHYAVRDQLVPGRNVLAVAVHQGSSTSFDLSFDLMLWAKQRLMVKFLDADGDRTPDTVEIRWSGPPGILIQADNPAGPWTDLPEHPTSPYQIPLQSLRTKKFFALRPGN